jgi:diguanylate cyclase (GGDEF)-like protein
MKEKAVLNVSPNDSDRSLVRLSGMKRPVTALVILATTVVCLLILAFAGAFISTTRTAQLGDAEVSNTNIARMIAVQVESTLKTANVTLTDISERLEVDGMGTHELDRLQTHLNEIGKASSELHGLFVYGADGSWLATSLSRPVKGNNSDREYFTYHRANRSLAVHIGPPIISRSTGIWIIPVSRRINRPDGSFGGVALVTLKINFFERIYDEIDIGKTGTVLLALSNGTLVYRRPFEERLIGTDISKGPVLQALSTHYAGSSILVSKIDRIERLYSYRHVDGYPFVVAVGRTKTELLSQWQRSSIFLGAAVAVICAMFGLLASRLIRQISIRDTLDQKLRARSDGLEQHNMGLRVLANTDKLTNIANRLMFDEILDQEFKRAQRGEDCLSLILLDVDLFKKFNDRYGHVAGDAVLRRIGRVMADQVTRAGDLVARYGGEEFVVILPSTGREGATEVAERIREGIFALMIPHLDAPCGQVSASFGVTTVYPAQHRGLYPSDVIIRADQQLYEAKRTGRNKVCAEELL